MKFHRKDSNLPAAEMLIDVAAIGARIQPCFPNQRALKLSIENIRYKPHTSCLVSYRAQSEQGQSRLHIKAFRPDDWETRKRNLITPVLIFGLTMNLLLFFLSFPSMLICQDSQNSMRRRSGFYPVFCSKSDPAKDY